MMPLYAKAVEAQQLFSRGSLLEAKALAEEVVAECDAFTTAHQVLARIYLRLGRRRDAADVYRKSLQHNPSFYMVKSLIRVLLMLKEYEEVEARLAQAERLDPGSGEVAMLRGDYMAERGRLDEALRWYEQAIEIDGSRVGVPARQKIAELRNR
jgi:tetratricopeptide (TPR) repeat protein